MCYHLKYHDDGVQRKFKSAQHELITLGHMVHVIHGLGTYD